MNLVDCFVKEILSEPYQKYNKWWLDVKYDSWGRESKTELMLNTKEEAENIKVGHKFVS